MITSEVVMDGGAPANGGGGGNSHNAGGGGGANGDNGVIWTGFGNPVSGYDVYWNLEAPAFATHTSSGGGRGGYSYGERDMDASTTPPGDENWGGDNRSNVGGFGGRPLLYTANRLFLGGGGGAGDNNNGSGSGGASGGGIIYLSALGSVSGTGTIIADGGRADDTKNEFANKDAPGGGGGGGAIVLNVNGTISTVAVSAKGGQGGSQI
jgi:hypothetical protein